jgi:hypothetical protein
MEVWLYYTTLTFVKLMIMWIEYNYAMMHVFSCVKNSSSLFTWLTHWHSLNLVTLTLIGGVQHVDASGSKIRGESHLLLVGDPGEFSSFTGTCIFIL